MSRATILQRDLRQLADRCDREKWARHRADDLRQRLKDVCRAIAPHALSRDLVATYLLQGGL